MDCKIKIERMLEAANAYALKAKLEIGVSLEGETVFVRRYAVKDGERVSKAVFSDSFKFVGTDAYELKDSLEAWAGDLCTPAAIIEVLAEMGIEPEDASFEDISKVLGPQREVLDMVIDYISYLEGWLLTMEGCEFNMNDEVEGYVVEVTETYKKSYFVRNVENSTKARQSVSDLYDREEITLSAEDLKTVDIECITPLGLWYEPGLATIDASSKPVDSADKRIAV